MCQEEEPYQQPSSSSIQLNSRLDSTRPSPSPKSPLQHELVTGDWRLEADDW